ncbi:hypothetical protein E4T43_03973 [Aureobasidium subglaciale]|nr:hypothetical protein E4T43_03973 [Aureobasidium subglaciale]
MSRLQIQTASPKHSIWHEISEDTFRQHLVDLEKCTNAVPIGPQTFSIVSEKSADDYTLPLNVEQQLADDLAFLAAIEEGAQSVAAVCLEEHHQPVRFAALDLSLSDEVKIALRSVIKTLGITSSLGRAETIENLFAQIVSLHFRRLLARLRSKKWNKPKYLAKQHKKPLWQDFANLLHRTEFVYTKREAALRKTVEAQVQHLAAVYEGFEAVEPGTQDEEPALRELIKASHQFCTTTEIMDFAHRLENSVSRSPTPKVASAIKCLRQLEKIAAYWRVATSLAAASLEYPSLFQTNIELAFLIPYKSIPTTIGYESWAKTCHVHAEVQLTVHYDILFQTTRPSFRPPRVIGTSKWLCYLCYLFLRTHGLFCPANTHGRLYDQWTIPDLADYGDELRDRYREVVRDMDWEVVRETDHSSLNDDGSVLVRWRAEPMTSREKLLGVDGAC